MKKFSLCLTAMMMMFFAFGTQAKADETNTSTKPTVGLYSSMQDSITDTYGKYVDFGVVVIYGGQQVEAPEVYYTIDGITEPSRTDWNENDPDCKVKKAVFSEFFGVPTIMLTEDFTSLKVIAYVIAGDNTVASDVESFEMTAKEVEKPLLVPTSSKLESLKITNADNFAELLYTKDGSVPSYIRFVTDDENVFLYDAENPIEITKDDTINIIGYVTDFAGMGPGDAFGSDMVRFVLPVDEEGAPELTLTPNNNAAVANNTEIKIEGATGYEVEYGTFASITEAENTFTLTPYGWNRPVISAKEPVLAVSLRNETTSYTYYRVYDVNEPSEYGMPQIYYQGSPMAIDLDLFSKGQSVKITTNDTDCVIWYTLDGSTPKIDEAEGGEDAVVDITLDSSVVVKAIAVSKDNEVSDVAIARFRIYEDVKSTLALFNGMAELEDTIGKNTPIRAQLTINEYPNLVNGWPTVVYYSTDGTEPTAEAFEAGKVMKAEGEVVITGEDAEDWYIRPAYLLLNAEGKVTLKAKAYLTIKLDEEVNSIITPTISKEITVIAGLNAPEFSKPAGKIAVGDTLRIVNPNEISDSAEAAIYFSFNGVMPSSDRESSDGVYKYSQENGREVVIVIKKDNDGLYAYVPSNEVYFDGSDKVRINDTVTILAVCYDAIAYGASTIEAQGRMLYASDFVSMEYRIGDGGDDPSANENKELAGVNLYPNPNDGEFNVVVPTSAQVDVFTATGMLVNRTVMTAGVHSLKLAGSGIYFVRFTAENGQVAVKRVIVR